MSRLGLKVLRFNSKEVLEEAEAVLETIYKTTNEWLNGEIPLDPPLPKGEAGNGGSPLKKRKAGNGVLPWRMGEAGIEVPPLKKGDRGI